MKIVKGMMIIYRGVVLSRTIGATVGISIGQAIYTSVCVLSLRFGYFGGERSRILIMFLLQSLRQKLEGIANPGIDTSPAALSQSVRHLKDIPVRVFHFVQLYRYSDAIIRTSVGLLSA